MNLANLWLADGPEIQRTLGRDTAREQWFWGDAVNPVDPDLTLTPVRGGRGDRDTLGQRLSAGGSATFDDVPVPADHVIGSLAPERVTAGSSLITPAIQAVFGHFCLGTAGVHEVTGVRSTASRHGPDLHWRNVRAHTLHDPVAYKRREVGLHHLTGAVPEFTLYT